MTKWEYLSLNFRPDELPNFQHKLNEFGELGWELVSMSAVKTGITGWLDMGANTSGLVVVFKRPKE